MLLIANLLSPYAVIRKSSRIGNLTFRPSSIPSARWSRVASSYRFVFVKLYAGQGSRWLAPLDACQSCPQHCMTLARLSVNGITCEAATLADFHAPLRLLQTEHIQCPRNVVEPPQQLSPSGFTTRTSPLPTFCSTLPACRWAQKLDNLCSRSFRRSSLTMATPSNCLVRDDRQGSEPLHRLECNVCRRYPVLHSLSSSAKSCQKSSSRGIQTSMCPCSTPSLRSMVFVTIRL